MLPSLSEYMEKMFLNDDDKLLGPEAVVFAASLLKYMEKLFLKEDDKLLGP